MDIPAHLLQRPSGFYFRLVIPQSLRHHYGKTEIRRALRTASHYVAAQRAKRLWGHFQNEFEGLVMAENRDNPSSAIVGQWTLEGLTVSNGKLSIAKAEAVDEADRKELEQFIKTVAGSTPAPALEPTTEHAAADSPTQIPATYAARMSVLIPKFLFAKQTAKVSKDQYTKYAAAMGLLAEIVGDKDVNHVTDRDVEQVQETLQKVPKHRNNTQLYKGKSLSDAIALADSLNKPRLDTSTVDFTIQKISAFFEWARKRKHLAGANVFENATILSRRERLKKSERTQFSPNDLQAIFLPENYRTIQSPSLYWLPLLSLFTSARLGELAQLDLDDVRRVKKIWCLYFNADGKADKNIKSDAANRFVPLHPTLIDLGFLNYVEEIRAAGHTLLFPTIFPSSKGSYAYTPSKEFAVYLDKTVGIREVGKVFHSFRHTAQDALKQKGVGIEMRCELAGQQHDNVNAEVYTNEARIGLKKSAISRLKFVGLDLTALKYQPGQFTLFIDKSLARREARMEKATARLVKKIEGNRQGR